jgi:tRNA(Ile)-lysidine synthase
VRRAVHTAVKRAGLEDSLLVVAVSGGPDSLALFDALYALRVELGLRLHGAHLDHGLRGAASRADAEFVKGFFEQRAVPYTMDRADVPALRRRRRLSVEEAAREARYGFLGRVAKKAGADAIALGHTATDQAETVLLNIVRGSGLTGLRGMEAVSQRRLTGRDVTLFRPLLAVSREDTVAYCAALGLEPRADETNLSADFARGRVRNEVMPVLRKLNPAVQEALVRLSANGSRDLGYVAEQAAKAWGEVAAVRSGAVEVDRKGFAALPEAIQGHVLRRAVLEAKGDLEQVEQNHIEGMARIMRGRAGRSLDLPGGLRFTVGYSTATLNRGQAGRSRLPSLPGEHPLSVPGMTELPGWRFTARVKLVGGGARPEPKRGEDPPNGLVARLSPDLAKGPLWVRARKDGDRFQPLGMREAQKLQDFMVNAKVPREQRGRIPLVVAPQGIAWVVGWRIAEWAKVPDGGRRCLELRAERVGRD